MLTSARSHDAEKARIRPVELPNRILGDTEQFRHRHGAAAGRGDVLACLGRPQQSKSRGKRLTRTNLGTSCAAPLPGLAKTRSHPSSTSRPPQCRTIAPGYDLAVTCN